MPEQEAEEFLIQILLLGVRDRIQRPKTERVFYPFPLSAQQPNFQLPAPATLSEGGSLATEAHFAHLCGRLPVSKNYCPSPCFIPTPH